jgi:hypothetical protein
MERLIQLIQQHRPEDPTFEAAAEEKITIRLRTLAKM